MRIDVVKKTDIANWLELVREVEPLFGPMIGEAGFQEGLAEAIAEERAFGVRNDCDKLCGVVVVSYERNEIEWLAVACNERKNGYGGKLLKHAITKLNSTKPVTVQTFDKSVPAGLAARNLYLQCGFQEIGQAELNPAGLPTVMLKRAPSKLQNSLSADAMPVTRIFIENIPAVLWGEKSSKLIVAVHGNLSNKLDVPIAILAEEAVLRGYQVLSFDLPQHGDRKAEPTLCKIQECVRDLTRIKGFASGYCNDLSLFACSMGAYFSLLAYQEVSLRQSLFLSPVVDMGRIIENMMTWFGISNERLQAEKEIDTPVGQTLYWDYYCYVKDNPIAVWRSPTAILYGSADNLCEFAVVSSFADKFGCTLDVMENGEHYFHTPAQLAFYRSWLQKHLR